MINAWLVGDKEVVLRFEKMPATVHDKLATVVLKWALKLEAYIKASKLSGQVLKVRTGTLRRSITHQVIDSALAVIGIVGTNVKYAARHEYGFEGTENVREHLRTIKTAFGKELKGGAKQITIHSFTREVKYPEHSFIRSALRELRDAIIADLKEATKEAVSA